MADMTSSSKNRSNMNPIIRIFAFSTSVLVAGFVSAADYPAPTEGDYTIRDFKFASGETLPELRLHYRTLSGHRRKMRRAKRPMRFSSCTGQRAAARNLFVRNLPASCLEKVSLWMRRTISLCCRTELVTASRASRVTECTQNSRDTVIGDMVEAQYRLLTEGLGVNHARLVMGTSMGGMHTWLWGELHPDFMDALMPLACLPTQISGRNRAWRRMVIDAHPQ